MSDPASSLAPRATFVSILVIALVLLGSVLLPLWKPLLLAAVLAAALASTQDWLARRLGGRRSAAALLLVIAVILVIVGPLATVTAMVVNEALDALKVVQTRFTQGGVDAIVALLPDSLQHPANALASKLPASWDAVARRAAAQGGAAAGLVTVALSRTSEAVFDGAMMVIGLFLLLVDGRRLVQWLCRVSPLGYEASTRTVRELHGTSSSVLISLLATALVQGVVATLGYFIAGVPRPVLLGLLTLFASFIPSVGTTIVALPVAIAMLLTGHVVAGVFLAAWGILVTGTIDNVLKPLLARNGGELNGGVVFFAMIGGIITYGALGLVVGPIAVSLFLTLVRIGWGELSLRRDPPERSPHPGVNAPRDRSGLPHDA